MSLATPSDAYLTDYSAEIYFLSTEDDKTLFHTYISYDMDKIKGHFGTEDYNKFRMKAWANVPLSDSEILRLRVYVLRNNEIEDFTVQYEAKLNGNKRKTVLPLKSGNSYQDADKIIFRSDYGHVDSRRNKLKHTNVEILNSQGTKINEDQSSFINQGFEIPNYERAIHYVLMQAEKHNPLVGALYWISPFKIHRRRAEYFQKSGRRTPCQLLYVLSLGT